MNTEVTFDFMNKELLEAVIIARDVLAGKKKTGDIVAVIGGDSVGVETAEFLLLENKDVTVIEMMDEMAKDIAPIVRSRLMERLANRVYLYTKTKVLEFKETDIAIEKEGKSSILYDFDTIVLAIGYRSYDPLSAAIKEKLTDIEVHVIGDAGTTRKTIAHAIKEGNLIGRLV